MPAAYILLKCIGKAVVKNVVNLFTLGVGGDILVDTWDYWQAATKEVERPAQVEAVAQLSAAELRAEVARVVKEEAAALPSAQQAHVATYLGQVPAMIRRSLRRPSDPSGRTTAPGTIFRTPDDLASLLPAGLPRFKRGDRPLPGVDWVLEELLGVGGFGEVWKARNPDDLVPPVALKFCLDPAAKNRLLTHEARIIGQVMRQGRHEGIVPLLHTYLSADPPCLEYEYIDGGDLAGLIQDQARAGGMSPVRATGVVRRLSEIVGYAHRQNPPIVHRDLKPANILTQAGPGGEPAFKITDFGIGGLAVQQAAAHSRRGTTSRQLLASAVRGAYTPLYASPQQMRGDPAIDPRDDVYALGVIWYQMLTGDLTTGRPGGDVWKSRLTERGMTPAWLALLASCFEDRREDRPASAGELCDKLGRALQGPVPASSPSPYPEAIPFQGAPPLEAPQPVPATRTDRQQRPVGSRVPAVVARKSVSPKSELVWQPPPNQTEAGRPRRGLNPLAAIVIGVGILFVLCAGAFLAVPITFSVLDSSKREIAKQQITGQLVPAVMRYKFDTEVSEGNLPNSLDDLLNSPKAGITAGQLIDPWGQPYQFSAQSSHGNEFDIFSQGTGRQVGNWKD